MRDFTVKQVQAAAPGRHRVSASLYLFVGPNGQTRRWIFRYTKPSTGKVSETGLGSFDVLSLAEARAKVHEARRMVARGDDPVEAKRGARAASVTFAAVAAEYIDVQARRFRNPGSTKNVRLLLMKHASVLGEQPIANIGTAHIDAALRPLWLRSPEQARRAVAAILRVLKYAKAKGLTAASTADMREDMAALLPHVNGTKRHFVAMDYAKVPEFVRQLRIAQQQGEAMSPALIEFIMMTVVRVGEAVGAKWGEIDCQERVWTIPANRMKAGRVHRVPLCQRATALLARQRGPNGLGYELDPNSYIWPGRDGQGHITAKAAYKFMTQTMNVDATIHGLRATFNTWAGNETNFDRVTCELALAHAAGNQVELAYRRGDELTKRRELMDAWSGFCEGR
jgi:integrase